MAVVEGWFTVSRKLLDSDLWLSEPFTRGQAWIDLIGLARFTPGHIRLKGVRIDLARGQLAWSEISLAKRWKRSRGWVRRVLFELEKDQRIVQHKSSVTSVITVVNYDSYQSGSTPGRTTHETAASTANDTVGSTANDTVGSTADRTQKNKGNNLKNGNTGNNNTLMSSEPGDPASEVEYRPTSSAVCEDGDGDLEEEEPPRANWHWPTKDDIICTLDWSNYQRFCDAYPNLNVDQSLRESMHWIRSDKKRRMPFDDMSQFISDWIDDAANNAHEPHESVQTR